MAWIQYSQGIADCWPSFLCNLGVKAAQCLSSYSHVSFIGCKKKSSTWKRVCLRHPWRSVLGSKLRCAVSGPKGNGCGAPWMVGSAAEVQITPTLHKGHGLKQVRSSSPPLVYSSQCTSMRRRFNNRVSSTVSHFFMQRWGSLFCP